MTFQVAVIRKDGTIEVLRRNLPAEVADSVSRHPSLHGHHVIVAPDFCELAEV